MTRLAKLVDQGDYRAAVTEAYNGRYGDREFFSVGGGSGGILDKVGSQATLGHQYNVERAVTELPDKHRVWLLWCYTDLSRFDRCAHLALVSAVDGLEQDRLKGAVDHYKFQVLIVLLMDNFKTNKTKTRQGLDLQRAARSMGLLGEDGKPCTRLLHGGKLWSRVRRGGASAIEKLDNDAVDALALRLQLFGAEQVG